MVLSVISYISKGVREKIYPRNYSIRLQKMKQYLEFHLLFQNKSLLVTNSKTYHLENKKHTN